MIIGIDASRAFQKNKTGIEEYSFQVIKYLREFLKDESVNLYCNPAINTKPDFELPEKWKVKNLRAPIFWTQIRLSLEMLFHPVDILFVPAHTVPVIHPKNNIVVVHGLEYEFCPGAYSFFDKLYMRWVIKSSCRWAKKIIAVSENTKKDLIRLYKVPEKKIAVVYNGIDKKIPNTKYQTPNKFQNPKIKIQNFSYFLFVGRLEVRKNICGIVSAFDILKEKYKLPHKLVLAGKFGYGEDKIKNQISNSKYKKDIMLTGYVSEEEKYKLLKNAEVFLFPTFYEGFGLPILEAQSLGMPVVTSNISSMPEITRLGDKESAVLVDPQNSQSIADGIKKLISDKAYKNDIIQKGYENVKRFSWEKCARDIAKLISNFS